MSSVLSEIMITKLIIITISLIISWKLQNTSDNTGLTNKWGFRLFLMHCWKLFSGHIICPFKSFFWLDMCQIGQDILFIDWHHLEDNSRCAIRSSYLIILWNWPVIFKIWSDNVRGPTLISSTGYHITAQPMDS